MEDTINKVIATLKTLDVRGFASMDALVGCVIALEQLKQEVIAAETAKEETADA